MANKTPNKVPDDAWLYFGLFILIVLMIVGCSWYFNDAANTVRDSRNTQAHVRGDEQHG